MTRKVTVNDVPRLLERLACGDAGAREETLGLLCPCRNRVFDGDIWLGNLHPTQLIVTLRLVLLYNHLRRITKYKTCSIPSFAP